MGKTSAVIHCNPVMRHQVELAEVLHDGLARHDIAAAITSDKMREADVHVVMGPHYALKPWRDHPRVLYVDRAYWGDPVCVSIHWLKDGEKHYTRRGHYRQHPQTKPYKRGERVLVLEDFNVLPEYEGPATVRPHPARRDPGRPLREDLDCHDIAVGCRTTALVDAAIHGLKVITADPYSPVWPITGSVNIVEREIWLQDLAWHNWSRTEIKNGEPFHAIGTDNDAG